MKTALHKLNVEKRVMQLDGKRCVRVLYEKAMVKSWIMLGTTPRVRSETYVLGWSVVVQIVNDNPHIKDILTRIF